MSSVEFFEDRAGEWRWHLKATNGEIVGSGEGHSSERDARRAFADMALAVLEFLLKRLREEA